MRLGGTFLLAATGERFKGVDRHIADVRREVAHRVERTARETRDSLLIIVLLRPLPSLTIVVTLARGLEGSTCRRTHQGAGGQVLSRAR